MRSSKTIILFGILLQVLVFTGQRYFSQLFCCEPILAPLRGLEMVVGFIVGALVDIAVGLWFVRSQQPAIPHRKSRAIALGSLVAATTRLMGTLISILIFLFFVLDGSSFLETLQGSGRAASLLNIVLVSLNPICSSMLIGIVFGGLGGVFAVSLSNDAKESTNPE